MNSSDYTAVSDYTIKSESLLCTFYFNADKFSLRSHLNDQLAEMILTNHTSNISYKSSFMDINNKKASKGICYRTIIFKLLNPEFTISLKTISTHELSMIIDFATDDNFESEKILFCRYDLINIHEGKVIPDNSIDINYRDSVNSLISRSIYCKM